MKIMENIIKVKGMMCGGCENRVKNAVGTIDGVESVEADFKTGIVKVIGGEAVKRQMIENAIEDIGFEIER